jgi:hypothetical protein
MPITDPERSAHEEQVQRLFGHRVNSPQLKLRGTFEVNAVGEEWAWTATLHAAVQGNPALVKHQTAGKEPSQVDAAISAVGFLDSTLQEVLGAKDPSIEETSNSGN